MLLKVFVKIKNFNKLSIIDKSACPELSLLIDLLDIVRTALPKLDVKYAKPSNLLVEFTLSKSSLIINSFKGSKFKLDLLKKVLNFFP